MTTECVFCNNQYGDNRKKCDRTIFIKKGKEEKICGGVCNAM